MAAAGGAEQARGPHGAWDHLGNPNECSECYLRGNPLTDIDLTIRDATCPEYGTWWRIYVWPNEMHTIRVAGEWTSEPAALAAAIQWLEDERHIPSWRRTRVREALAAAGSARA